MQEGWEELNREQMGSNISQQPDRKHGRPLYCSTRVEKTPQRRLWCAAARPLPLIPRLRRPPTSLNLRHRCSRRCRCRGAEPKNETLGGINIQHFGSSTTGPAGPLSPAGRWRSRLEVRGVFLLGTGPRKNWAPARSGGLTCFVGYSVGFGHRLLVTQVDRRAPLESRPETEKVSVRPSAKDKSP